jgi:two-component sensor histidine kinase
LTSSSTISPDDRIRALEQALREKEAALRELQHRTKNSLQLVISLLKLQSGRIRDPDARAAFDMTLQRIEALAIAYRHLHESGNDTQVEIGRYLSELVTTSTANAPNGGRPINVEVQAGKIVAGLSLAMPLGLIVNELLSACLRHAFPDQGWVRITLNRLDEDSADLVMADNGRGLPPGFDPDADAGMLLAEALAAQLGASLTRENDGPGTLIRLSFPL